MKLGKYTIAIAEKTNIEPKIFPLILKKEINYKTNLPQNSGILII